MTTFFSTFKQIGFFTIALTLALVANFAYGQWVNPTQAPTGGNVEVPINTSGASQIKTGNLGIGSVFVDDTAYSNRYCNLDGSACATVAEMLAGGGGVSAPTGPTTQLYSCPNVSNTAMTIFGCPSSCNGQVSTRSTCGAASRNSSNNRCEQVPVNCAPISVN